MFATYFRWRIKTRAADRFIEAWTEATEALKAEGSHGSVLYRLGPSDFAAIARWPDQATRDAAFAKDVAPEAKAAMEEAVAETLERIDMDDEVVNLWTKFPAK